MKGTLHGKVRYFQDFAFCENEFLPDLVFTAETNAGNIWLWAPGYGDHDNYGCGAIVLLPGEFERAWRPITGLAPSPELEEMRRVIVESPYAGDVEQNVAYARACIRDCLKRGEAPIASHLLFTQPQILRDDIPDERSLGIEAGLAWQTVADAIVVYTDRGISNGMADAIERARVLNLLVEYRRLPSSPETQP